MRQITSFLFLFICCAIILSCNNATQKEFEFYYYPARNVYYDITNNLYLYSLDGGKTWDSVSTYTNKEPAILGSKQIIYSTTPYIWKDNKAHVSQYKGQVINITGNDSSLVQNYLVAERKIKKVIQPLVTEQDKKPEKKPGFFKRLFGQKN
jgi:hypothetical protein